MIPLMEFEATWAEPGILKVVWPPELTDGELEDALAEINRLIVDWGRPQVNIHKAASPPGTNGRQRRRISEWAKAEEDRAHRHCAGLAFVTRSPITRGIITAIFWFTPPPYPVKTFAREEQAITWAAKRLDATRHLRPTG